jgi:hypothetical protein
MYVPLDDGRRVEGDRTARMVYHGINRGRRTMATPIEQLEAMNTLSENWDGYGAATPIPEAIELAKDFVQLLSKLQRRSQSFDIFVSPGRDGGVLVEWSDVESEHELEINADGTLGFLHTDKLTGVMKSEKFSYGRFAIPAGLFSTVGLLVSA